MNKTFNLYCDESCHLENDRHGYMLISYISAPYNQITLHHEKIRELKQKHHFYNEIKWSNVSHSKYAFFDELVDYFFATELNFRSIIVDKSKIDNETRGQDYDTFYYLMYYQLLHHKINMEHTYNIYLDIKDTLSVYKIRKLREILNIKYSCIRNLQNIVSKESLLMQLTDLLMGAISYHLNNKEKRVIAKRKLIEKIQSRFNLSLNHSTSKSQQKFNLFFIDLK